MRSSLMEPGSAHNPDPYRSRSTNHSQHVFPPPAPVAPPKRRLVLSPEEGWLPLLLLTVAVYSVVYSVTSAISISHNEILWLTTILGLVLGLGIAKAHHFPQTILHVGACIFGYWLSLFLTSILAYHTSIFYLLAQLRSVLTGNINLVGTLNSDMIFLFYLAFLCFFLGYFGSWLIYRAHLPWLVALVYVSIMVVNLNYVPSKDLTFLVIILAAALILLIARIQLASQLTQWRSEGLYTDRIWLRDVSNRFLRIATLFMILVIPFSWALPVPVQPTAGANLWNNLDNAWSNVTHGHLPSLADPGSLFAPYQPSTAFFGDQLSISGNVNLPTGPVLSYTTSKPGQGAYLEGFTFDTFDGHTWTARNSGVSQSYRADSQLQVDVPAGTQNYGLMTTSVTMIQPPGGTKHYIFGPAQPISFSVPVTVYADDLSNTATAWAQSTSFGAQEQYQVVSALSSASRSDLAAIGLPDFDAGDWQSDPNSASIFQHYLQWPGNISPQVIATARNWTSGSTNAYEIANALASHLSNSAVFTYSLTNPPVPANVDAVTWLLQTRQGYCTYYATAMTVMARQLGLPARIVNGFSAGQYNAQKQIWQVNGNDAHSWVQIYFPNFGWINFDPTPGFPLGQTGTVKPTTPTVTPTAPAASPTTAPANKPKAQPTLPPNQRGTSVSSVTGSGGTVPLVILALLVFLGGPLGFGLFILFSRKRRMAGPPVASVYARLCRFAGLLGSPPAVWQTPYEYLFGLSQRFPRATNGLHHLADLFVRERWAPPSQVSPSAQQQDIKTLWPGLRNAILRSFFHRNP